MPRNTALGHVVTLENKHTVTVCVLKQDIDEVDSGSRISLQIFGPGGGIRYGAELSIADARNLSGALASLAWIAYPATTLADLLAVSAPEADHAADR